MELLADLTAPPPSSNNSGSICAWSSDDFFNRVKTYKISTWLDKPLCLSPLECARFGWINCSKDMLECVSCKSRAVFRPHPDLDRSAVKSIALEFRKQLENVKHKENCGWRDQPSVDFGQLPADNILLLNVYQTRSHHIYESAHKFPVISKSFITSFHEAFKEVDGPVLLQKALLTDPSSKSLVSCILSMCGWDWKQSVTNPASPPNSPPPSPSPRTPIASPKSPVITATSNEFLFCSYCQREIGLWNHICHQDPNSIDDDYLPLFKGQDLTHKQATRIDFQNFGKTWDRPTTAITQNSGWGWGSSIAKIVPQDKHKTIQKESFHPIESHRWFCPEQDKRVIGWEQVARALKEGPPPMEEQALDVMNILDEMSTPVSKRRRVDS